VSQVSGRALFIDGAAVLLVGLAVVLFGERAGLMWTLLGMVIVARFFFWARLPERTSWRVELAFFVICTLIGAFNDFNTVVRHGVYGYELPAELPSLSTIPLWMLVYWGLIVRFVFTLTRYRAPAREERRGKLIVMAVALIATRQCIYVFYEDPVLSWLPFAIALLAWPFLVRTDRHDWTLAIVALTVGPLAEALLIGLGGLHHYELGWVGGVPLWIVLWWVLATWIWKDLGLRIQRALENRLEVGSRVWGS